MISSKISLSGPAAIQFVMLADKSVPNAKEQKAISAFADAYKQCVNESESYRRRNYSAEANAILDRIDAAVLEANIDLYNKKISFGKYNSRLQKIDKESRAPLAVLAEKAREQEEASRARAVALREAQTRQEQTRQRERAEIVAIRERWEARCNLDYKIAYNAEYQRLAAECDAQSARARSNAAGLAALACTVMTPSSAKEFAQTTFDACMSGAPAAPN